MAQKNHEKIYQLEEMIKKYNKKPEKKIKKKDIISMLHKIDIIIPVRMDVTESNCYNEVITNASMVPDVVKDGGRSRLLPIFSSYSQIPSEYMESFSFIKVESSYAYDFVSVCDELNGMVLNPFTEYNFEIRKKAKKQNNTKAATRNYEKKMDDVEGMPKAIIIYNNQKYEINKTPFTIGRDTANIVIPESYISKIHVVISYKDGKYRVADYDSTNGTEVNGTSLRPKVYYELRDGYTIKLSGKEEMIVYIN